MLASFSRSNALLANELYRYIHNKKHSTSPCDPEPLLSQLETKHLITKITNWFPESQKCGQLGIEICKRLEGGWWSEDGSEGESS